MRIDQSYIEEYVIKPLNKRLKDIEATMWTVKNDIAKLIREIMKEKDKAKK